MQRDPGLALAHDQKVNCSLPVRVENDGQNRRLTIEGGVCTTAPGADAVRSVRPRLGQGDGDRDTP